MEKNKRMTTILIAGVLLLTVIGVTFAYFAVSVINGTRQNLSATTVESVNLTLDDNDSTTYSGQVSFGSTVTRNLKLTNEGGPTKVALYFQDLINTYTAGAFTYTLSYSNTENGSYTAVATDVAIPRRSKASSTAKITEIEMPATTTRYYRMVITYNHLETVDQTRDLTAQFKTGFTIKAVPKTIAEAHPNGDYLKDFCELNASGECSKTIFDNDEGKILGKSGFVDSMVSNTVSFITLDSKTPPTGTTYATNGEPWDVSQAQDGSVMAWVTPHKYIKYFSSLTDCQTEQNAGTVTSCESITATSKWNLTDRRDNYLSSYNSEKQCIAYKFQSSNKCVEIQAEAQALVYDNEYYDLYVGQDGGVVANPNNIAFFYYAYFDFIDLSHFNTQYLNNLKNYFNYCNFVREINFGDFNTSNATDMFGMFYGCSKLIDLDVSNFDTSNVTNMSSMFRSYSDTSLNVSSFDTANVTNMESMFRFCQNITNLLISNFDTSNVTNMSFMFSNMKSLENLNVLSFNTSSVTDMSSMFSVCSTLEIINATGFDTSNVTDMSDMFNNSTSLITVRLDNATFDNVGNNYHAMFAGLSLSKLTVYVNQNGKDFLEEKFPNHVFSIELV